jgi:hypothetical protein
MNRRSYLAVGLVVLAIGLFVTVNQRTREHMGGRLEKTAMEGETLQLTAFEGKTLGVVRGAKYGDKKEAWNSRYADEATVAGVITNLCTGKTSCSVRASNDLFGDPAPGVLKSLTVIIDDGSPDQPAATPAPAAAAATPQPGSFPSLSSMYDSSLAYVNTLTGGTKTAPDSLAAPEPVEFNWPVIGTIIGTVTVLILVTVFYPRSNPVATGARRVKRI